ncbi:MAG: GntR family transcriptional regulator [Lentisphaeria bacterium]|nr:GntR family transcriptional regulator [Lentisphaeria bacterium]
MSISKYPNLAATLEQRIHAGIYRKKLPTVRELAAEFHICKQTVTLALRPLIQRGLLKTSGRQGIHVVPQTRMPGLIGIVFAGDMMIFENDIKLQQLQERIHQDGFESSLIGITDWISSRNVCKMLGEQFSGIIFTNSTLTYEIAEYLDQRKIPFVSCNSLPVYPNINYVETRWRSSLRQIVNDFRQLGFRKQALFFHGRLEGYNTAIRKEWRKIKSEFELPRGEYDRIRLDYRSSTYDNLNRYLEILHKKKDYPELLICWTGLGEREIELLTAGKFRLPAATRITGYQKNGTQYPDQITAFSDGESYAKVLQAAYEALREVILAETARKIHRTIENPITYQRNLANLKED